MTFYDWDPLARAGLFGGIFIVSLIAILWLWYDSSSGDNASRWYWRVGASLLVALTIPAVFLGAANLDSSKENLLNIFAWVCIGCGVAALLVVAAYAVWGDDAGGESPFELSGEATRVGGASPFAGGFEGNGFGSGATSSPTVMLPPEKPAPEKAAEAYLFVKDGPDKGRRFGLTDAVLIGRGETCAVVLSDRRVSSQHAQVKQASGNYVFLDMKSSNGSFLVVNGREQPLRTSQVLVDGDVLRLGQTLLEFVDTRKAARRP